MMVTQLFLVSPLVFSLHPNRSRQTATHTDSGSAGLFLSTVQSTCSLWELLGFSPHVKASTVICCDLVLKMELKWKPFPFLPWILWSTLQPCLDKCCTSKVIIIIIIIILHNCCCCQVQTCRWCALPIELPCHTEQGVLSQAVMLGHNTQYRG